ncbi:MAG: hypothetical protein HYZ26_12920 [Chloroflexi bacterium]|nr:hypothetical protein [Chloroflexota bacterium]
MTTSLRLRVKFALVAVMVFALITACTFEAEKLISSEGIAYSIDPDTILDALEIGDRNVFLPREDIGNLPQPGEMVGWNQEDYLLVVETLHELAWGETLEEWDLTYLSAYWLCNDLEIGIQNVNLLYQKIDDGSRGGVARFESDFNIDPRRSLAEIYMAEYGPSYAEILGVDPSQLEVVWFDIVNIAEMNGGVRLRATVQDECTVDATIRSDVSRGAIWEVTYRTYGGAQLGNFLINAVSEKVNDN